MGRFVSPAGVVFEMSEAAARNVGFKPVSEPKAKPRKRRQVEDEADAQSVDDE